MNRQPKGQSTGGQFAPSLNPESNVELGDDATGIFEVGDRVRYCDSVTGFEGRYGTATELRGRFVRVRWDDGTESGELPFYLTQVEKSKSDPTTTVVLTRQDDYEGEIGNQRHPTRFENGTVPMSVLADMPGVMGETPGARREWQMANRPDSWREFVEDIRVNGIRNPIFVTVKHYGQPKISEGNHRRDAALELGLTHVPVEVRYFGHAEQKGSIAERAGVGTVVVPKGQS